MAAQLRARWRQPGLVRGRRRDPDRRAVPHAGRAAEAGVDVGARRARVGLIVALAVYGMPVQLAVMSTLYGAAYGLFPIAWVVFSSIMLYRLAVDTGKFEIIKDSVGEPDRRSPAAGDVHRVFVRRVHRGRGRLRRAGGRVRRDARRPRVRSVLRRRHLSAREHRAGCVRIHRHSGHHARRDDRTAAAVAERDGRTAVRDDLGVHSRLPDRGDGWARASARSAAGDHRLRRVVRRHAVLRLELRGPGADRHRQLAHLHRRDGLVLKFWKPKNIMRLETDGAATAAFKRHPAREVFASWLPYLLLVVFVLAWGQPTIKAAIDGWTNNLLPSSLPKNATTLNGLNVPGSAQPDHAHAAGDGATRTVRRRVHVQLAQRVRHGLLLRDPCRALLLRLKPSSVVAAYTGTFKQLKFAMLTIASMLGLAYLMNYSGHDVDARTVAGVDRDAPSRSSAPSSAGWACS